MTKMILLVLVLLHGVAHAACDPTVTAGAVGPRTGLQKIKYRQCNWNTTYNANIDIFEAGVNASSVTLQAVNDTNYNDFRAMFAEKQRTLKDVGCYCWGTITTLPTFVYLDTDGDTITKTGSNGCVNGASQPTGTMNFEAFDTNDTDRVIAAGGHVRIQVSNTPSGSMTCTLLFRYYYQ